MTVSTNDPSPVTVQSAALASGGNKVVTLTNNCSAKKINSGTTCILSLKPVAGQTQQSTTSLTVSGTTDDDTKLSAPTASITVKAAAKSSLSANPTDLNNLTVSDSATNVTVTANGDSAVDSSLNFGTIPASLTIEQNTCATPGFDAASHTCSFSVTGKTAGSGILHLSLTKDSNTTLDIPFKVKGAQPQPPTTGKTYATYWTAWGGNISYSVSGLQGGSKPSGKDQILSENTDLKDINSKYNLIIASFIAPCTSAESKVDHCTVGGLTLPLGATGNSGFTRGPFSKSVIKSEIQDIEKDPNRHVIVSLGGQNYTGTACDQTTMVPQLENIIEDYNFQGLDLDLESGALVNTSGFAKCMANVMSTVKQDETKKQGQEFLLTVAPEWTYLLPPTYPGPSHNGISNRAWINIINTLGNDLNYIMVQTYNQGQNCVAASPLFSSNGVYAVCSDQEAPKDDAKKKYSYGAMLESMLWGLSTEQGHTANNTGITINPGLPSQDASKILLGIPAVQGAANGEWVPFSSEIAFALKYLRQHDKSYGGFMDWSADWDNTKASNTKVKDSNGNTYVHNRWDTINWMTGSSAS